MVHSLMWLNVSQHSTAVLAEHVFVDVDGWGTEPLEYICGYWQPYCVVRGNGVVTFGSLGEDEDGPRIVDKE